MGTKLVKLSDTHYVIADDSKIKKGDFKICLNDKAVTKYLSKKSIESDTFCKNCKKITYSTEPLEIIATKYKGSVSVKEMKGFVKIKPLSLSEVEEAIYGYSVEKIAQSFIIKEHLDSDSDMFYKETFEAGFKAHRELVKDKLFTSSFLLELVPKVLEKQRELNDSDFNDWYNSDFLRMLFPKTEWDIEFIYPDNTSLEMSYVEEMYLLNNPKIKLL